MPKVIFGAILIAGASISSANAESTWFQSAKPLSTEGYWDVRIVPPNKWPTKIWTVPPRKSSDYSSTPAVKYNGTAASQKTR